MIVKTGGWRPVQGAFHAFAAYSGFSGLVFGPAPGQAIADVVGGPNLLSTMFYGSLFLGGLIAMVGEIMELKANKNSNLERYIDGSYVEAAGCVVIALNFAALTTAVFYSDAVPDARARVYIFIFVGFIGRACQAIYDVKRIREGIRKAAANGKV